MGAIDFATSDPRAHESRIKGRKRTIAVRGRRRCEKIFQVRCSSPYKRRKSDAMTLNYSSCVFRDYKIRYGIACLPLNHWPLTKPQGKRPSGKRERWCDLLSLRSNNGFGPSPFSDTGSDTIADARRVCRSNTDGQGEPPTEAPPPANTGRTFEGIPET